MAFVVELRQMTDEQLEERLEDAREELFNLRFQKATAQLENYSRIHKVRHDMAQIQEIVHKRAMAVETAAGEPEIAKAIEGQEWTGEARFDYEQSGWLVKFKNASGRELATAHVNLNKVLLKGRRARRKGKAPQRVTSIKVAG
jgi:large subunit ribosomal protein L29